MNNTYLMSPLKDESGLDIYPGDPADERDGLTITVRFSASLPDLEVSLPQSANTARLKQHIRKSLPQALFQNRLRLIHAGKALEDGAELRIVRRPVDIKGKGKVVAERVYIHCSIGDIILSASDLLAEETLAKTRDGPQTSVANDGQTTTTAPRGFDRLLTAGFSPAEVLSLRQQFLAIQAHSRTPDEMPDPDTLRDMEDSWLDSSNARDGPPTGENTDIDDLIWGTVLGFFWPAGCLLWALREEGIFSPQRQIAIVFGVMLNLILGFIRWGG